MENLSPFQVFSEVKNCQLDISSAINILTSSIENSDSIIIRAESLKSLGRLLSENKLLNEDKIFYIIENCVTSDESPQVRNVALHLIIKYFCEQAEVLLRFVVLNERSALILRNLIYLFETSDKKIINSLRNKLEYKICDIFGVNFEEAKFFLDLHISNPHLVKGNNIPETFYKEGILHSNDKFRRPSEFSWYVVRKGKTRLLSFHSWKLCRIPKSIKNLSRLNYLDLRNNKLRSFPKSILSLMKLRKVNLAFNKDLKTFSKSAFTFAKQNLAQKYIAEGVVPEEAPVLGLFEMLTGLKMENKKVGEDHESGKRFELNEAGHIIKLTIIPNEDFSFTFIPRQISRLTYLKELKMIYNAIKYLPDTLGTLKRLRILDLRGNNIRIIPNSVQNLKNLRIIK